MGEGKIVSIQYLRALAALLVVAFHAAGLVGRQELVPEGIGKFGVDLFFVISGYIMWATTVGTDKSPGQFWLARIIRVAPLYWLFTSAYVALAVLAPSVLSAKVIDTTHIIESYLFIPATHLHPFYALGWTLNYEMFFYCLFGLSLLVTSTRLRLLALFIAITSLVVVGVALEPSDPLTQTYTNELLIDFLVGIFIAVSSRQLMMLDAPSRASLILIAIGWLMAGPLLAPSRFVTLGIPACLVVAAAVSLEPLARTHPIRTALLLGDASYSLYLSHAFVAKPLARFAPSVTSDVLTFVVILLILAAAALFSIGVYLLIERPMLRALSRARRRLNDTQDVIYDGGRLHNVVSLTAALNSTACSDTCRSHATIKTMCVAEIANDMDTGVKAV